MSADTDNYDYSGLCLWDSCIDCPHKLDCPDSEFYNTEEIEDD